MGESWDEYAEGWDSNPDVILYADNAYQSLCETLDISGLDVLDFGCGTGLLTEKISPKANKIVGIDSSKEMILALEGKQLKNVEAAAIDISQEIIRSNPIFQSPFDLIVASSVCAFVPNYERTLKLLKLLLMEDGILVQWDWLKTDDDSDFGFSEEIVRSAFNQAGLEVLSITKAFTIESSKGSMPVIMGIAKNA